jgi:hypothetical protein
MIQETYEQKNGFEINTGTNKYDDVINNERNKELESNNLCETLKKSEEEIKTCDVEPIASDFVDGINYGTINDKLTETIEKGDKVDTYHFIDVANITKLSVIKRTKIIKINGHIFPLDYFLAFKYFEEKNRNGISKDLPPMELTQLRRGNYLSSIRIKFMDNEEVYIDNCSANNIEKVLATLGDYL